MRNVDADRFAGCLVGQALGDALGFIVEGHGTARCATYVADVVRPRRLDGQLRGPFALGQYSDDTQLARELARSLVACRGLDPAEYAGRIAALFTERRIVGRGQATTTAALRIAAGVPWRESGVPPPSAGNGSAMRAAPAGLFHGDDPRGLVEAAHDQGWITHQDPRCAAGAIAIAGAAALAARTSLDDPAAICATLAEWTGRFDPVLSHALRLLPGWLTLPLDQARAHIAPLGLDAALDDGWDGISPAATPSVLWSLFAALRTPGDYWESICTAIAVGGDVDTTAAMTGAVAGAAVGLAGIPAEPAALLTDRGTWDRDALVALAHELHAVAAAP